MINEICLKFGPKGLENPLKFQPGAVTIFVGPNNAGKSVLLREIEDFCNSGRNANSIILDNISFDYTDDNKILNLINDYNIPFAQGERQELGHIKYGKINSVKGFVQRTASPKSLIDWRKSSVPTFCTYFISLFTARFSGKERFNLINDVPSGDLLSNPTSNLMSLFQDDVKRKEVRDIIFKAFGKYFVIDPTSMNSLRIKLSDTLPENISVERGWEQKSVEYHKKGIHISQFSDGVQAFTGLILATMVGNEKYIFIDEPEAFLHPNLSNMLGKKLSELMNSRDGNLIVSTHSPHFVMGCIQSGVQINIVRLTYDGAGNATARLLPSEKVNELFKNPLLRSTGTLQALFFNNVIVTEADADRAFYNEINERMSALTPSRGIENCLFINAQNKQSIWTIVKPLRELGIPAAAIVDIDVIKDGGSEFTKILESSQIPQGLFQSYQNLRNDLKTKFVATKKDMKKDGGIDLLPSSDQAVLTKFVNDLAEYGVFIVKNGELESWLKTLKCSGHGPSWLINIFNAMGSNQNQANYLQPGTEDVWKFIEGINAWFKDSKRRG